MDIIGKLYSDYFFNIEKLDGRSHLLKKIKYGGLINIFKDKQFKINLNEIHKFNIFIISDRELNSIKNENLKNLNISFIKTKALSPSSFIIEINGERTSFVINDEIIKIEDFKPNFDTACIFYGDKINSNIFTKYKQIYLDTAGNSIKDLYNLADNKNYPKNSIVSISKEYIKDDLIKRFINSNFIVLAHCPTNTTIFSSDNKITIKNRYYINPNELESNDLVTGLGDKFFILFSYYNRYQKLNLTESVKQSQKVIHLSIKKEIHK